MPALSRAATRTCLERRKSYKHILHGPVGRVRCVEGDRTSIHCQEVAVVLWEPPTHPCAVSLAITIVSTSPLVGWPCVRIHRAANPLTPLRMDMVGRAGFWHGYRAIKSTGYGYSSQVDMLVWLLATLHVNMVE